MFLAPLYRTSTALAENWHAAAGLRKFFGIKQYFRKIPTAQFIIRSTGCAVTRHWVKNLIDVIR